METTDSAYPVRFDVDYPEEPRNRLTLAFRLILAIPILAVIAAIGAAGSSSGDPASFMCIAAGVLFLPSLMLIVARQKYPRWWFDFSVAYLGFHNVWKYMIAPAFHDYVPTWEIVVNKNVWAKIPEDFQEMMKDADYLYGSLIKDIYYLGKVLGRKYRFLRIAYSIFMFGFVVAILSFIIAFRLSANAGF